jgi:hypothetical protein
VKFKSIKLHNFMRYKGDNELSFSCDEKKNVTVVLGNNTFGKTTLAQAFRWGLYEELNSTNYTKKGDIVLLNNEVIATMGDGTRQTVSVEIVMEEGNMMWRFTRTAVFKRKHPGTSDLSIIQDGSSKLTMMVYTDGVPGKVINDNGENPGNDKELRKEGCVQDTINNLLPSKLSNYFFFDGERWSDTRTAKSEIKESINTILGVTGLLEMKKHIKDGQGKTVLKTLRSSIKGSGDEYERLQEEIATLDKSIAEYDELIKDEIKRQETAQRDRDALEQELNDKHKVEEDQKMYKQLSADIERYEDDKQGYYADIVKMFSESARYFSAGLLPKVNELLESIDVDGKDIPGVTTDTVDYLINQGQCLCGTELTVDSEAYKTLMVLRKVIPPEMIGGAAGKLQEQLISWENDKKNLIDDIEEKADGYDTINGRIDEKARDRDTLEKRMDRKANVEAIRRQYKVAVSLCHTHESKKNEYEAKRDYEIKQRDAKNKQLDQISRQYEANRAVNYAIAYAEAIYDMADRQAQKKEDGVFDELNGIIAVNFDRMFNDGEKYAKLQDDYRIHVYYHSLGNAKDYEETNLSNGEATAINFVYIVSVLELAKRRSAEADENARSGVINLPLVLDGPFSSLSNENTNLIAKKLPEFAEQVIIFMLDKDWEASGLDSCTKSEYRYRVSKDEKANSSSLEKGGVE